MLRSVSAGKLLRSSHRSVNIAVQIISHKIGTKLLRYSPYCKMFNISFISYCQVPGGVGPMTIAMLLRNAVNGCRRSAQAAHALKCTSDLPTPPV